MNLKKQEEKPRRYFPIIIVGLVFANALLIVGSSASTQGTATSDINAIMADKERFLGRAVKLEGKIVDGTVRTDKDKFDIYFDIAFPGMEKHQITIHYTRALPDPFKVDRVAVVEGILNQSSCQPDKRCSGTLSPCTDNAQCKDKLWIEGSKLTVKCPSKYQQEQGGKPLEGKELDTYRKQNPEHFE